MKMWFGENPKTEAELLVIQFVRCQSISPSPTSQQNALEAITPIGTPFGLPHPFVRNGMAIRLPVVPLFYENANSHVERQC
jgi:hypothetical protein